jgi:hypothetical protein
MIEIKHEIKARAVLHVWFLYSCAAAAMATVTIATPLLNVSNRF